MLPGAKYQEEGAGANRQCPGEEREAQFFQNNHWEKPCTAQGCTRGRHQEGDQDGRRQVALASPVYIYTYVLICGYVHMMAM